MKLKKNYNKISIDFDSLSINKLYKILLNKNTKFDQIFFAIDRKSKSIYNINKLYNIIDLDDKTYMSLLKRHLYSLVYGRDPLVSIYHIIMIQQHINDKYSFYDFYGKHALELYYKIFCGNVGIKRDNNHLEYFYSIINPPISNSKGAHKIN